jgi:hypothetical protein
MTHSSLKTRLRSSIATRRAILAHDLRSLLGLTLREACARTGASIPYLCAFNRITPEQRDAVRHGKLKLAHIANGYRPTPAAIDSFIARAGVDRIFDGLDRATRPMPAAANGNGGKPPFDFDPPFTATFFPELTTQD